MKVVFLIDDILKERGMSRRELARRTDIRQNTINDMCINTAVQIPLANLARICEELECGIPDIMTLEKERPE